MALVEQLGVDVLGLRSEGGKKNQHLLYCLVQSACKSGW